MKYYPPVGFRFKVKIEGVPDVEEDMYFQSVGGLSVDIETEEYAEGGENRFKHKLPVRTKYPNLVLKRGLLTNSEVIKWCKEAIEDFIFTPKDIVISLFGEANELGEEKPLATWKIASAIPVKWSVDEFNAEQSKIVTETLELAYQFYKTEINAN